MTAKICGVCGKLWEPDNSDQAAEAEWQANQQRIDRTDFAWMNDPATPGSQDRVVVCDDCYEAIKRNALRDGVILE